MSFFVILAIVLLLLLFRQNLIFILMAIAIYIQYATGGETVFFVQDLWSAISNPVMLSVPLFILVGVIMSRGSIANKIINVLIELTRPIPGGLGVATIFACAFFSAISGSSIVTMLAVGTILYKALVENKYSKSFAIGAICSGGTLGIIIPPSIPLILYGLVTETSIADLFLAGIGPGLLLTSVFATYSLIVNFHHKGQKFRLKEAGLAIKDGFWALMLPVVLLGGIYSGIFSPTESAAVSVFYALMVEVIVYRELTFKDFSGMIVSTGAMLGALFPLIAIIMSLNLVAIENQVPQDIVAWTVKTFSGKEQFILALNGLLLAMGALIDTPSAILVSAPLLPPVADHLGIDRVHLGIMMILNLEIGFLTPPFGLNLIVAVSAFNESFATIVKAVIPFIFLMLICLAIIIYVPWISLALL
jgi:C4-dicarboxylate transporter DctM subunit